MSNLDNLVAKIEANGSGKAQGIIDEAKRNAEKTAADEAARASREKDEIISAAKAEAERQKEQIITRKRIAVRDAKIRAKQELFDMVLSEAARKLKNMPEKNFASFLTDYLAAMNLSGEEELILPKKYKNINLQKIGIGLTVRKNETIDSGFAIIKGGMEYNNTFEALFDYYRDDLEKIISETLF